MAEKTEGRGKAARRIADGVVRWGLGVGLALVVGSGLFATGIASSFRTGLGIAASALLVGLASAAVGALFGLLFGLPREASNPTAARYSSNTNLLKVSDWITTILVGLTLVNLRSLGGFARSYGDWIAPALGGHRASASFGIAVTLIGALFMFIFMYLWSLIPLRVDLEDVLKDLATAVATGEIKGTELPKVLKTVDKEVLDAIVGTDDGSVPPVLRSTANAELARRSK